MPQAHSPQATIAEDFKELVKNLDDEVAIKGQQSLSIWKASAQARPSDGGRGGGSFSDN